jgi:hypothetical protein
VREAATASLTRYDAVKAALQLLQACAPQFGEQLLRQADQVGALRGG